MGGKGKAYRLTTELEHHMMRDNTTPLTGAYDPEVGSDWIRLMTMIVADDVSMLLVYHCALRLTMGM